MSIANILKREEIREWLAHLFDHGDRVIPAAFVDPGSAHVIPRPDEGKRSYGGFLLGGKKGGPRGYEYWDDLSSANWSNELLTDIRNVNVAMKRGVAASLAAFGSIQGEHQRATLGLKAFGVDVDQKNFESILPGVAEKRLVIEAAIHKLDVLGIRPQLVVNSGSGFHIYILVQRINFESDAHRKQVKRVWCQLSTLWSRTDKFDLAAKLRIPGTIHWKNGVPKPVGFIRDLCDLERPRYTFEHVAEAVKHVPVGVPITLTDAKEEVGVAKKTIKQAVPDEPAEIPKLVQLAIAQDAQLKKLLAKKVNTKFSRSEQDFAVAMRLIELGTPGQAVEEYLAQTPKAKEHPKPEHYASGTLGKALEKHESKFSFVVSCGCLVSEKFDFQSHINSRPRREEDVVTEKATTTAPIHVFMKAPGRGRTTNIIDWLARDDRGLWGKRIGFSSAFISELIIHERNINSQFPGGISDDGTEFFVELPIRWTPPSWVNEADPQTKIGALADELRNLGYEHISIEKLQAHFAKHPKCSLVSFYLNAMPPVTADNRFSPFLHEGHEEEDKEEATKRHAQYIERFKKNETLIPMAVARSSAKPELCIAFQPYSALKTGGPCVTCGFRACRANKNYQTEIGEGRASIQSKAVASRLLWKDCRTPLLTHSAWATDLLLGKHQAFEVVVFDERPAHSFRTATLEIAFDRDDGNAAVWRIHPLDGLITRVNSLNDERVAPLRQKLKAFRKAVCRLVEPRFQAHKRTKKEERTSNVVRRPSLKAPLSEEDFVILRSIFIDKDIDEDLEDLGVERPDVSALSDLQQIYDLCISPGEFLLWERLGDGSLTKRGQPVFSLYKFVSGWRDIAQAGNAGSVVLDATAGIDPAYLLLGNFASERYAENNLARAKVVVLPRRAKGDLDELSPSGVAESLVQWSGAIQQGILVLGPKSFLVGAKGEPSTFAQELDQRLRATLGTKVGFGTFGALRGRNDLVEYDAVYLLNPHRYSPEAYFGLAMLAAHKMPVQETFQSFNTVRASIAELGIEERSIATEMIQDVMRIALRSDERMKQLGRFAHVFLPVDGKAGIVVRVAAALAGCTVVANGKEFVIPPTLHQEGPGP